MTIDDHVSANEATRKAALGEGECYADLESLWEIKDALEEVLVALPGVTAGEASATELQSNAVRAYSRLRLVLEGARDASAPSSLAPPAAVRQRDIDELASSAAMRALRRLGFRDGELREIAARIATKLDERDACMSEH